MANRNALPIFSTSRVDSGILTRNASSPRLGLLKQQPLTPLSSKLSSSRENFRTPTSLSSRQKWKSSSSVDSGKKTERLQNAQTNHMCSPSLSPRSCRPLARFCSDTSLNDSTSFDTPVSTPNSPRGETSNFIVGVRVRPFNAREEKDKSVRNIVSMRDNEVSLTCLSGTVHMFSYDHCFWSFDANHPRPASQATIFQAMAEPLLDQLLLGYNACLLAYGQTGSGKSYSMMGPESGGKLHPEAGVIPRFCASLFERIRSYDHEVCVEISYYEIYNEKIHDLLSSHKEGNRPVLRVRENPTYGPYVVDLAVHGVTSFSDVKSWMTVGNSRRITAATGVNEKSSRSHSIFSIIVTQKKDGVTCRSRANLVDLAGSERVAQTALSDHQLKEGVSINKSLLSLGKVITFLSERGKRRGGSSFGPYRESVLTWLLKESLGGNSKTAMLATISPANVHLDETLATLRYACQARSIVNRVHPNENPNERIIRELRLELEKMAILQAELEEMKKRAESGQGDKSKQEEIDRLKLQLRDAETKIKNDQRPWEERVKASTARKSEELQYLRGCGVSLESEDDVDSSVPCLVTLSPDPILSGTLLYLLPPGKKTVGRSADADIVLHSPLVGQRHCEIENRNGRIWVQPVDGVETFVNGVAVTRETELLHGDRLAIAGVHFFRVRAGQENKGPCADFELAQKELKREQEARLRNELRAEMDAAHAQEMQGVLALLDAQNNALQRNALANEPVEMPPPLASYKSTFLDELNAICSGESKKLSLLDMHFLVREATERCRDLQLDLEFFQEHLMTESGLIPVIRVLDSKHNKFSIWNHSVFFSFLDTVRDVDTKERALQVLDNVKCDWENSTESSRPSRRISVKGTKTCRVTESKGKETLSAVQHVIEELQKNEEWLENLCKEDDALEGQLKKALPHFKAFLEAFCKHNTHESSAKSVTFASDTTAT